MKIAPDYELSTREHQVAVRIAAGRERSEIAEELGISEKTYDSHRMHALGRLGLRNNADLTRYALGAGWVTGEGLIVEDAE